MCSANGVDGNGMPWRSNQSHKLGFARVARLANRRAPRWVRRFSKFFECRFVFASSQATAGYLPSFTGGRSVSVQKMPEFAQS
jgi:hypothetical protein